VSDEDLVGRGYDEIAERFGYWRASITGSPDADWVGDLIGRAPDGPVLELGCGQGGVGDLVVVAGRAYSAVDLSAEQLRRAAKRVPGATLIHGDMRTVELQPGFAAVVSIYAFTHVPRGELPELLGRIHSWLQPGGCLLATFGTTGVEGVERDWLGVPMFFSSATPEENLALLDAAAFEVLREEVVAIEEPEGEAQFHWVLARRQTGPPGPHRGPD
jgi:cyclopropane fatty-acyl-phospholipid synthase-like methyltransferase